MELVKVLKKSYFSTQQATFQRCYQYWDPRGPHARARAGFWLRDTLLKKLGVPSPPPPLGTTDTVFLMTLFQLQHALKLR